MISEAVNLFSFPHIVANTESMDMDTWRELRKSFLGGSDAAAAVGLSRYKTPIGIYYDKIGTLPDISDSKKMKAGRMLEPIIAEMFAEETGKHVVRQPFLYQHPEHTFMAANIDFGIYGENAGLECKNSAYRKDWEDDQVPDEYFFQCQHYMAVTNAERWYLAYMLDGWDFNYVTIERNQEIIDMMIGEQTKLWDEHILLNIPPEFDGSDSAKQLLNFLYPRETPGLAVDLPNEIDDWIASKDALQAQIKELDNAKTEIENRIKAIIQDNEIGVTPMYWVKYKTVERKESVVSASSYRRLFISKRKITG